MQNLLCLHTRKSSRDKEVNSLETVLTVTDGVGQSSIFVLKELRQDIWVISLTA